MSSQKTLITVSAIVRTPSFKVTGTKRSAPYTLTSAFMQRCEVEMNHETLNTVGILEPDHYEFLARRRWLDHDVLDDDLLVREDFVVPGKPLVPGVHHMSRVTHIRGHYDKRPIVTELVHVRAFSDLHPRFATISREVSVSDCWVRV